MSDENDTAEPSCASGGWPCPNGCGAMRLSGRAADGYPISQCDFCNAFALNPVPGREPPLRRVLRALHEVGLEPGSEVQE